MLIPVFKLLTRGRICLMPSFSSNPWYVWFTTTIYAFEYSPQCPPTKQTAETILQVSRNPLTFATMKRRAHWPSVAEAAKVRSTAFYSKWHEEAFEMHLSHGLVPIPRREGAESTGVQLATPKWAEAAVFAETEGLGIGWDKLAELKVPVGFVMAGDPRTTMGEELTGALVWRPAVSANERFMDAGHLVSSAMAISWPVH